MASSRISIPVWTLVFLFLALSEAKEILVGGKENSWSIAESSSKNLNQWAEKTRFRVGDVLKWKSDNGSDSVVQVTKNGYDKCDTSNPIKGGSGTGNYKVEVEFTLDRSGPFYFVSGVKEHCEKGLKLVVVVISQKHGAPTQAPAAAPAAPPSNTNAAHAKFSSGFMGIAFGVAALVGIMAFI